MASFAKNYEVIVLSNFVDKLKMMINLILTKIELIYLVQFAANF